jgi:hypothetical protein
LERRRAIRLVQVGAMVFGLVMLGAYMIVR